MNIRLSTYRKDVKAIYILRIYHQSVFVTNTASYSKLLNAFDHVTLSNRCKIAKEMRLCKVINILLDNREFLQCNKFNVRKGELRKK